MGRTQACSAEAVGIFVNNTKNGRSKHMSSIKTIVAAAALCAGCIDDGGVVTVDQDGSRTNTTARYLCVGMETSRRFGSCPGCALDAQRMTSILSGSFGYSGDTLISAQATKAAVVERLRSGIASTPEDGLFLFCYSGHGGQEYVGGKEPEGADAPDEYLCLYDTYMLDDEIWDIVSKCRGRVFLYFDACHSATMYRSVASDGIVAVIGEARAMEAPLVVKSSGFTFRPEKFVGAQAMGIGEGLSLRMLCWSGCREAEYSYGGSAGGVMTCGLARNWKKGMTYSRLWPIIVGYVRREQPTQNPTQTKIGSGFGDDVEAFR